MRNARFLLLDDDKIDAEILIRAVRSHGFENEIVVETRPTEALRILRESGQEEGGVAFDCIILDLGLPLYNGLSFLNTLRADQAIGDIDVAVYTGSENDLDKKRADALGVLDYIRKSSVDEDVKRFLDNLLCESHYSEESLSESEKYLVC